MKKLILIKLSVLLFVLVAFSTVKSSAEMNAANIYFDISFPASAANEALDGRLLLLISTNNDREPRFQINEDLNTQQVFGLDVDGWKPGETKTVDQNAFGYPIRTLSQIKPGEYWVQAFADDYHWP